jgi:hypothetical protein
MKKALLYTSVALSIMLGATSCPHIGGGKAELGYYIYVTGDTGKTVQISYLGREILSTSAPTRDKPDTSFGSTNTTFINYGSDNAVFTEDISLPFFKEVTIVHGGVENEDVFLTVSSEDDTTTKAILFDNSLYVLRADRRQCFVLSVIRFNLDRSYDSPENCDTCTTCRGLTPDSILNSLKSSGYPCYLEFEQGDTHKTILLKDG